MNVGNFKNKHKRERCYILGNGPSLSKVDLEELDGVTFGTNRIYLADFVPDYYCCVNPLVFQQFAEEILGMETTKFLSDVFEILGIGSESVVPINTTLNFPHFETDLEKPIWEGHTVSYVCLQLAYYMGFEEVILLGVDHYYGQEKQPNLEAVATGPDEYHFDPDYFTNGVRWNYPDLRMSEIAYSLAKKAFEDDGRKIVNCSHQTKLKVFDVVPFNNMNSEPRAKVSAIVSAYKCKEFIAGCLEDLGRQTLQELEIVIVVQADSEEEEIAADTICDVDYPHTVRMIFTDDIPTVYHAWNLGIKSATGKYITNANTDDHHHPQSMEILANILDARPDIDVVYHDQFITWIPNQTIEEFVKANEGKALRAGRWEMEPGIFKWQDHDKEVLSTGCYLGPQPMWRANLHQRHGYFIDEWKSAGDYEFWLRVAEEDNFLHVPVALGLYLARADGLELSQPQVSFEESTNAILMNQYPGGGSYKIFNGHVKASIGGNWIFHPLKEFYEGMSGFMEEVKKNVTEKA